jgi:FlaA1/EpsC-like NDP-sugar epimerase
MNKFIKNHKLLIAYLHDIFMVFIAWVFSYLLRFNFSIPEIHSDQMWKIFPFVIAPLSIFFLYIGLYRGLWRFASLHDLRRIIVGAIFSFFLLVLISFAVNNQIIIPRSILIIFPVLLVFLLGINRFLYRFYKEGFLMSRKKGEPILILGAGTLGIALSKELITNKEFNVVGFLDDDSSLHNREINHIKILGDINYLPDAVRLHRVKQLIVAVPSTKKLERKKSLILAAKLKIKTLVAPSVAELVSGKLTFSHLRNVEVADLLGREIIDLNTKLIKNELKGKKILLTGAGGSIGSELCRQVINFKPEMLICFDISELALYQLEESLKIKFPGNNFIFLLGDIKNSTLLDKVLTQYKPDIVFHTAAYKHVPLVENDNVSEAFNNNVVGTYNLAVACKSAEVQKFILISTDKAVNPTNIMGASKRLAEMVCEGLQEAIGTKFVIVRFGNVLDSSGSVIPKFRSQISSGGPITVTHPQITRFFMAIPEAAQLVMQASVMGGGGEVFVLDMGAPVRIVDLAKNMINLSGLSEDQIKIKFTGLRPGEKLYEEILIEGENILPTRHKKIFIATTKNISLSWVESLILWVGSLPQKKELIIKRELKKWVQEYHQKNNDSL